VIQYILTRSNRKTAAIYIRNGQVEVRAPHRMPKQDIDRFVSSKEQWIIKNLTKQQIQAENKDSFALDYGSDVIIRDEQYPITPRSGKSAGFDGEELYMPPGLAPEQIKATCIQIYKILAKAHLCNRVSFFAAQMGLYPSTVKVNSAKTRWGSCSSKKSLNFSWRLIMADDDVIDYVVVHELAHLKEMNHSPRFWGVVTGVLPDYKKRKAQLKILQKKLASEDWG